MFQDGVTPDQRDYLLRHCDRLRSVAGVIAADRLSASQGSFGHVAGQARPEGSALMVVSASPGDGRTTTAVCLALALASSGRTLLVDVDNRNASLTNMFALSAAPGLTDILLDGLDIGEAVWSSGTENLSILPFGRDTGESASSLPSRTLEGDAFAALIAILRERWDYVVFDTPPLFGEPDALLMAHQLDGALLVLRAGRTQWEVAQDAAARLSAAGGHLIGAVLNRSRHQPMRAQT